MTTTVEHTLAHFGVLGQRWGVRRSREELARASTADNPLSSFSNQELQAVVNRMQLEKQLYNLTASQQTTSRPVAEFTKKLIGKIASNQVDRVANKAADVAVEALLGKAASSLAKSPGKHAKNGSRQQAEMLDEVVKRLKPKKK